MISAFVSAVRRYVEDGHRRPEVLGAYKSYVSELYWVVGYRPHDCDYACRVWKDGSAQLLSRDEDECLLFSTLWELSK